MKSTALLLAAICICLAGCSTRWTLENVQPEIIKSSKGVDAVTGCLGQAWLVNGLRPNSIKTSTGYTMTSEEGDNGIGLESAMAVVNIDRVGNSTVVSFRTAFASQRPKFMPLIEKCI